MQWEYLKVVMSIMQQNYKNVQTSAIKDTF